MSKAKQAVRCTLETCLSTNTWDTAHAACVNTTTSNTMPATTFTLTNDFTPQRGRARRKGDGPFCEYCWHTVPWAPSVAPKCLHATGVNIDLGCAGWKQRGFVGLDMRPLKGVDLVWNIEDTPWPLPDNCVNKLLASHLMEHISPAKTMQVWEEMWRVLDPNGQALIVVPHGQSYGMLQDPTHASFYVEATFAYFAPAHESNLWQIYRPSPWRIARMHSSAQHNIEAVMEPIKACRHGLAFEADRHLTGLIARCDCCVNIFPTKPKKSKPGDPRPTILCRPCSAKPAAKRGDSK